MKTDLHYYTQKIAHAATRPRLRQKLHYECGLYKDEHQRSPVAALHLDHCSATPLIKLIAVTVALMLGMWAVCGMIRWRKRLCTCHTSTGRCDCH